LQRKIGFLINASAKQETRVVMVDELPPLFCVDPKSSKVQWKHLKSVNRAWNAYFLLQRRFEPRLEIETRESSDSNNKINKNIDSARFFILLMLLASNAARIILLSFSRCDCYEDCFLVSSLWLLTSSN